MQGRPLILRVCIGAALLSATVSHARPPCTISSTIVSATVSHAQPPRGSTIVSVSCGAGLILPRGDPASVVANAVGGVDIRELTHGFAAMALRRRLSPALSSQCF